MSRRGVREKAHRMELHGIREYGLHGPRPLVKTASSQLYAPDEGYVVMVIPCLGESVVEEAWSLDWHPFRCPCKHSEIALLSTKKGFV